MAGPGSHLEEVAVPLFHRREFRKAKEQLERPQEVTEATGSGCSLAEKGKSHALA